jgi:DNA-binding transcriptional LysR family regulator
VLSYQVAGAIAAGALRLVLRDFEPEPIPVHLVYASQSQLPLKLRAFLDFAAPRLKTSIPEIFA